MTLFSYLLLQLLFCYSFFTPFRVTPSFFERFFIHFWLLSRDSFFRGLFGGLFLVTSFCDSVYCDYFFQFLQSVSFFVTFLFTAFIIVFCDSFFETRFFFLLLILYYVLLIFWFLISKRRQLLFIHINSCLTEIHYQSLNTQNCT